MQLASRVILLCLIAAAMFTRGQLVAGPAEDLSDVARFFPAGTEGFLYFKSPGEIKGLFRGSVFVSSERVEKHLEETYGKFAAATGFHPVKNSDWIVMNSVWPEAGKAQNPLLFVHGAFNLPKLLPAIEKDPMLTGGEVTKEMVEGRPLYTAKNGAAAGFPTDTLLVMGDAAPVKVCLQVKKGAKPSFEMEPYLRQFDPAARMGAAFDLGELAARVPAQSANPAVSALLSKMVRVVAVATQTEVKLAFEFHEAQEAKAASDMIGGLKEFAKSYFTMTLARFQAPDPTALLSRVSPEAIYSSIVSEAMSEFLGSLAIVPVDRVMTVKVPRDKLPFLDGGDGPIALAFAGAAVAIPNFVKGRDVAARTACHQNQRILQAAVEHFTASNKSGKKATLSEIVDKLIAEGTLAQKPEDPGEGKSSFAHYSLGEDGKVTCSKHGSDTEQSEGGFPGGLPSGLLGIPGLSGSPSAPSAPSAPSVPAAPPEKPDEAKEKGAKEPEEKGEKDEGAEEKGDAAEDKGEAKKPAGHK